MTNTEPPVLSNIWEEKGIVYFAGLTVKENGNGDLYVEAPNSLRNNRGIAPIGNQARIQKDTATQFGIVADVILSGIAARQMDELVVCPDPESMHLRPTDKS